MEGIEWPDFHLSPTLQMKIQMFWVVESCRLSSGLDCRMTAGFFWKKALVLSYPTIIHPPENGCLLSLHCKPRRQQSWIMESLGLGGGTWILISGGVSGTGHRTFLSPVRREKRWQYWWLWRWKRKKSQESNFLIYVKIMSQGQGIIRMQMKKKKIYENRQMSLGSLFALGYKNHEIAASTLENTAFVPHYPT